MKSEPRNQEGSSYPGLNVNEDFAFAAREWKIQRAGWFFFGLLTLAGILGLFGRGFLSSASVSDGPLHLQYERFERFQRPTDIRVRISGNPGPTISVLIDRAYLDAIRIERIMPQPEKAEANARGLVYQFLTNGEPITITFHLELEQFGRVKAQIGLVDGPILSFNHFVYP
jgi:hypothetical protein